MDWKITKGIPEDAAAIAQFQVDMARESEGTELDYNLVLRGVTLGLQDEAKGTYFIARDEAGTPLGSLLLTREWSDWTCTWYWWIQSVFIRPEYRRQGAFSCLYETVRASAREEGSACLRLYVDRGNSAAQECYRKQGMDECHYLMFEETLPPLD